MFESLGFSESAPREISVVFGLLLGLAFGIMAEMSRFCFRRGLVGDGAERRAALGVWLAALAVAVIGTQAAVQAGWVAFDAHRFLSADLPYLAVVLGGLAFGAGMVLTRGCVSRLTVLAGSGNLRSALVLVVFAVTAHATLKGVLAPLRTGLGGVTLALGDMAALSALPGGWVLWSTLIALPALAVALRSGARRRDLAVGAGIGLLAAAGWIGTGFILFDEFDPIALESLSFTAPATDGLFWLIASSAVPAGFGTGLFGGVLAGAFLASVTGRRFAWASFESPVQTGRYLSGAVLMGVGGVLAGGCTVGAGLSGVPTLSVAALLAILSVVAGARIADRALSGRAASGSGARGARQGLRPAE